MTRQELATYLTKTYDSAGKYLFVRYHIVLVLSLKKHALSS